MVNGIRGNSKTSILQVVYAMPPLQCYGYLILPGLKWLSSSTKHPPLTIHDYDLKTRQSNDSTQRRDKARHDVRKVQSHERDKKPSKLFTS